jgi:hypothetical protein
MNLLGEASTSDPQAVEDLIRAHGLDPEDWIVVSVTLNRWDSNAGSGETMPMSQLKVSVAPKVPVDILLPARLDGPKYKAPKKRGRPLKTKPQTVVVVSDQQAPFHDKALHSTFLRWLDVVKPDQGVVLGDLMDLPDVSRHRWKPEWSASVQDCLDSAYTILRDYRESSSQTSWSLLAGNHDDRLRNALIDNLRDLYGLRKGKSDSESLLEPVLSLEHLLRLDELGIRYVDPEGSYDHGQLELSPSLAARHGWIARKGSGASARASLEQLGYSVLVGHTHRQGQVAKTSYSMDGEPSTHVAAEIGAMCDVRGGLGYAVSPDWQQGFCTVSLWPDGAFNIDLARVNDGALYWRDSRYSI